MSLMCGRPWVYRNQEKHGTLGRSRDQVSAGSSMEIVTASRSLMARWVVSVVDGKGGMRILWRLESRFATTVDDEEVGFQEILGLGACWMRTKKLYYH